MDGQRFDRLSRTLASTSGRRGFVRLLAGALLGGAAARSATAGAACPAGQADIRGVCVCKTTMRPPVNGACACGAGQTDCGPSGCKDLSSDLANCGTCGTPCPDPDRQLCRAGQCWCLPGLTQCGDRCVDLLTDPDHCGSCGTVCAQPTPGTCQNERICSMGTCTFTPLPANTVCRPAAGDCDVPEICDGISLDCPPDGFVPAGRRCRPAAGPCDTAEQCSGASATCPADAMVPNGRKGDCPGDWVCRDGACVCPEGTVACEDGHCGSLTDPTNCGCGGVRCPLNETCDNGACNCRGFIGSAAPFTCCPGGFDRNCAIGGFSPNWYVADTCSLVSSCPEGYTACDGGTGDPDNPIDRCRACCPPGTTCDPRGFCRQ